MKMFEKSGRLQLAWKPGSGLIIDGHGGSADIMLALTAGIKEAIESAVPPEHRMDCARELSDLLLD